MLKFNCATCKNNPLILRQIVVPSISPTIGSISGQHLFTSITMSTVNRVVTAWVIYSTSSRADYCITKGINYSPLLVQDLKHTHTHNTHIIMWQCKSKPIRLTLPQQVISASLHFVWRRRRVVIKGWLRGSLNLLTSGQPNSTCFVWIQRWSQNQNRWTQLGCAVGTSQS